MKNKIIIFSVDYYPYVGGAEVAVRELCKRIDEYEYVLITARNNRRLSKEEVIDNVKVLRVGIGSRRWDKFLLPVLAVIKAWFQSKNCVIVWGIMANPASLAALVFKFLRRRITFLLTIQEGWTDEYLMRRNRLWWPLYASIYKRADYIQVISSYLEKLTRKFGYTGPVALIPNGVDLRNFNVLNSQNNVAELKKKLGLIGKKVIITVSRLSSKNGLEDLIRAFGLIIGDAEANRGSMKLLIVGDGEDRRRLQDLAYNLGLTDLVIFTGHVSHSLLAGYLGAADVFIRPSFSEGLGNSFLEAMACGLPVIGTPVGGIVDFLVDKKFGMFCEPGNPRNIADAIKTVFNNDDLRRSLSAKGQRMVKDNYDWDTLAEKMRQVFKICENRSA